MHSNAKDTRRLARTRFGPARNLHTPGGLKGVKVSLSLKEGRFWLNSRHFRLNFGHVRSCQSVLYMSVLRTCKTLSRGVSCSAWANSDKTTENVDFSPFSIKQRGRRAKDLHQEIWRKKSAAFLNVFRTKPEIVHVKIAPTYFALPVKVSFFTFRPNFEASGGYVGEASQTKSCSG
jgi:hypothetical protein